MLEETTPISLEMFWGKIKKTLKKKQQLQNVKTELSNINFAHTRTINKLQNRHGSFVFQRSIYKKINMYRNNKQHKI